MTKFSIITITIVFFIKSQLLSLLQLLLQIRSYYYIILLLFPIFTAAVIKLTLLLLSPSLPSLIS